MKCVFELRNELDQYLIEERCNIAHIFIDFDFNVDLAYLNDILIDGTVGIPRYVPITFFTPMTISFKLQLWKSEFSNDVSFSFHLFSQ